MPDPAFLGTVAQTGDGGYTGALTETPSVVHTLSAGTNRIIVGRVVVGRGGAGNVTATATYGGVAMTLVRDTEIVSSGAFHSWVFFLINPSGTGSKTYQVTFNGNYGTGGGQFVYYILQVDCVQYADQTTGYRNTGSGATGSGTAASTAVTTVAGDLVVDALGTWDPGTEGAGQYERVADSNMSYEVATGTTTTMSWTISSNPWALTAVPIMPQAAAAASAALVYIDIVADFV